MTVVINSCYDGVIPGSGRSLSYKNRKEWRLHLRLKLNSLESPRYPSEGIG